MTCKAVTFLAAVIPAFAQYQYKILPPTPDLPNNGTVSTYSSGINNSNQIAGYEVDPTGNHFVVVWTNGKPAKLALPTGYVFLFSSIEINDSGQVLTNAQLNGPAGPNAVVLWTNGVAAILPPGPNSCGGANPLDYAIDLNNLGH